MAADSRKHLPSTSDTPRFRPQTVAPRGPYTETPTAYLEHLQHRTDFTEFKCVGLAILLTRGAKGRPEWAKISIQRFASHCNVSAESIRTALARLCERVDGADGDDSPPADSIGVLQVRGKGGEREYRIVEERFAQAEPKKARKIERKPAKSEGIEDAPASPSPHAWVVLPGKASRPFLFPQPPPHVEHVNLTPYPLSFEYHGGDGAPVFRVSLGEHKANDTPTQLGVVATPKPKQNPTQLGVKTNKSFVINTRSLAEPRVRALADTAYNRQNLDKGVDAALDAIEASPDPKLALEKMEANLPGWWAAMSEGRADPKQLRYVIIDGDWLHPAPKPVSKPSKNRNPFREPMDD